MRGQHHLIFSDCKGVMGCTILPDPGVWWLSFSFRPPCLLRIFCLYTVEAIELSQKFRCRDTP